jgi:hypothetical protein
VQNPEIAAQNQWTIEAARAAMLDRHGRAVRSIYRRDGSKSPVQTGSCVLLEVRGLKFIVSAAHVTDFDPIHDLLILGEQRMIPIEGRVSRTEIPPGGRRQDKIDLAYYLLSEEFVEKLGQVSWIQADDLDSNDTAADPKLYITLGFPNSKNKRVNNPNKKVSSELRSYVGRIRTDLDYSHLPFRDESHVMIWFDRHSVVNEVGQRANPVDPRGMSGGGAFSFDPRQTLLPPEKRRVKLVGILIEHMEENNLIIASRVSLLQAMMSAAIPELAHAFVPATRLLIQASASRKIIVPGET